MFKGLIDDFKSAAASFIGTYLARALVGVSFLIALGLATAALGLELADRFGSRNALWILAAGFCVIGILASLGITVKEEVAAAAAEEEEARNEGGIGEMTSAAATAAATQAATQLPSWLWGALLNSPSTTALPLARLVGRNLPLVVLLVLVALLFWPAEPEEEGGEKKEDEDSLKAKRTVQDTASAEALQEAA